MLSYDTKPLFHIYPYLDAGEYRGILMGNVVKYPDLPTERYLSSKSATQPNTVIPGLDPTPTELRDIKFLTHGIKDDNLASLMNAFVEGFFQSSDAEIATAARLWHMDSASQTFRELMKNKAYSKQLINLLRSSHDQEAYFITEIVTLFRAAGTKLPIVRTPALVGGLGYQDLAIEQDQVQGQRHYPDYYEGETIVFLGYHRVKLERSNSILAKLARVFFGHKYGFAVQDRADYWPQGIGRPAEKSQEMCLGDISGRISLIEDGRSGSALNEHARIARELGFDVEIVG
jgi:hypothetical protein